jgi:hypothetical protein
MFSKGRRIGLLGSAPVIEPPILIGGVPRYLPQYQKKRRDDLDDLEEIEPKVVEWIHTVDSHDRLEGKNAEYPARNSFDDSAELIALAKRKRSMKIRILLLG